MDIIVSNAVHDFLSSAPFYLRFPSLINDRIWDTALACTERELDAKRSYGLLALYSYLELALIRATKRLQDPPNLEPLREVILSDDVLARLLFRAGVCDFCTGQESEQVSRAFSVFAEMVITDRGTPEFVSWFAHTFDPIISVVFEACNGRQPDSVCTTPTKRIFPFHDGTASKRWRTAANTSKVSPPVSTLAVLRQLRQRQMLSAPDELQNEICIVLDPFSTEQDLEGVLAKQMAGIFMEEEIYGLPPVTPVPSPVCLASVSPPSAKDARLETSIAPTQDLDGMGLKWSQESPTALPLNAVSTAKSKLISPAPATTAVLPFVSVFPLDCEQTSSSPLLQTPYASPISAMSAAPSHSAATTTVTPSVSATSFDSQQPTSSTSPELQTHYVSPIASNSGVINVTDDFVVTKDLEDAAVLFINETIEMAKRSELLPTSITPAPRDRRVPTEPRAGSKRPSNKKAKQAMARRRKPDADSASTKRKPNIPLSGGVRYNIPSVRSCQVAKSFPAEGRTTSH
ncbi:hypothetical protein B0H13DRAFT_2652826 [Mycena leptocephala]|nr:hypothetical protein B0H13DRAFT_2652826 [Mycena leptocephala]